jgi:hypothetical protein
MFLIDRPASLPGLRADLAPRQLFGGGGDLVRAALTARPSAAGPAASAARRAPQLDQPHAAPSRRRKAG